MQSFIAIGKVYKEPKTSQVESGLNYTRFSIAIPKQTKNGNEVNDFFTVVAWGKAAEKSAKLVKDTEIVVKGEFHSNSYTDAQGVKKYSVELTLSDFEILNSKPTEESTPIQPNDEDLPF